MIKTLNAWLCKTETLLKTNACHSHGLKIVSVSVVVEQWGMQIGQDCMYAFLFPSLNNASLGTVNEFLG